MWTNRAAANRHDRYDPMFSRITAKRDLARRCATNEGRNHDTHQVFL